MLNDYENEKDLLDYNNRTSLMYASMVSNNDLITKLLY